MYTLVWTSSFTRAAEKFIKHHGELRKKFAVTLRDLESDPFQPHLKYHPLGGKFKGIQAINVKLAQAFVCPLAHLWERVGVRETGMAGFIIMGSVNNAR